MRGGSLGQSPAGGGWEMMGRSLPVQGTLRVILCCPLRWPYVAKAESSQRYRRPARRAPCGTAVRPRPGSCRETEYLAPKLWTVAPRAGLGTRGDRPAPCSERLSQFPVAAAPKSPSGTPRVDGRRVEGGNVIYPRLEGVQPKAEGGCWGCREVKREEKSVGEGGKAVTGEGSSMERTVLHTVAEHVDRISGGRSD